MPRRRVARRKPHFVKVLFGDFSQQLRIPPNFVKHFSREYHERAILEGPSGGIWPVELQTTTKGVYLSDGWPKFVKDNTLHEFEFLLFRYEGRMHFSVSVFDTSACEREDLSTVKRSASCIKGLRKQGRPQKYPHVFGCHTPAEKSRTKRANVVKSDMHGRHHSLSKCLQLSQLDVEIKIEEDELPISAIGLLPCSSTFGPSDGFAISQGEQLPMSIQLCGQIDGGPSPRQVRGYLSQRRPVSLQERERTYEAAYSFTSSFPFFIQRMSLSSVYRTFLLKVPAFFAKAHLPHTRTELVLEDPTGRAWSVRYIPNVESKMSGGWAAFARGNNLEEGDFCVFELVRPVELHVHIFRVVEEITPLIKAC